MIKITGKKGQILKRFLLSAVAMSFVIVATPGIFQKSSQSVAQITKAKRTNPTNVVIDWNETIAKVTQAAGVNSQFQFRAFAIAHTAIFDAANAVDRRYTPYLVDIKAPAGTVIDASVASAGYTVLKSLYPEQQATLDVALTASLAKIPEGQSKTDGINIGQRVAEKIVALRIQDGWDAKVDYKPHTGVGVWQPTPPTFSPAITPQFGNITPFTFKNTSLKFNHL